MLRYKIYAVVTHPLFPNYAYKVSLLLLIGAIYILFDPEQIEQRAFVSENALSTQTATITSKDLSYVNNIENIEEFLTNRLMAKQWNNTKVYYNLIRGSRTNGKDCMAFIIPYNKEKDIGVEAAYEFINFVENKDWVGSNLLFLYYDDSIAYAFEFRKWLDEYITQPSEYFGIIREAVEFDLSNRFSYFTIVSEGINGVQTDVDMLVSVLKSFSRIEVINFKHPEPVLYNLPKYITSFYPDFWRKIEASLSSWYSLWSGNVHNAYSYALDKGILSLAIKTGLVKGDKGKYTGTVKLQIVKLMETLARTFTSLDETMHAGSYFYYFSGNWKMITLGKYAFVIGVLILPLALQSILILRAGWFNIRAIISTIFPVILTIFIAKSYLSIFVSTIGYFSLIGLALIPLLFLKKEDHNFLQAYTNVSFAVTLVVTSLHILPMMLIFIPLIPLKILAFIKPSRKTLRNLYKTTLGIIAIALIFAPLSLIETNSNPLSMISLENLYEIEMNSSHQLLSFFIIITFPSISHIIYLAII